MSILNKKREPRFAFFFDLSITRADCAIDCIVTAMLYCGVQCCVAFAQVDVLILVDDNVIF